MSAHPILIVDDEPDIRELLEITLNRMDLQTRAVADLKTARQALEEQSFSLCLTDMNLPDGNGLNLVSHIQEHHSDTPVAVITAYGNVETAITALKSGAFDFVSKPIELERLRGLVATALRIPSKQNNSVMSGDSALIGESPAAIKLRKQIIKLARSQAPVYIRGESGSGKELVARLIHANSPRADQAFVAVNCGAIPTELMESEFFGHRKGSFTGAVADKPGLFQTADSGTLFLDEVADLPLDMQVKLLRAIQEKSVRAVGDNEETAIDVRLLSATHKSLEQEVQAGRFRQDLYYRINVIELAVPALRERNEDIRLIGEHLLHNLAMDETVQLSEAAWQALQTHNFPGNVRELQNILERACALSENQMIEASDLQLERTPAVRAESAGPAATAAADPAHEALYPAADNADDYSSLDEYLEHTERQAISRALEKTRWNKTAAAELLGISFRALRYKLKKLNID